MIYDISPIISADLAVWPGDTPSRREVLMDMKNGDNLTLSTWRSTVHAGSHADAPCHYARDAISIEGVPVERFVGSCEVVNVRTRRGERFSVDDLAREPGQERVLFRTNTYPDPRHFNENFAALEPGLVDWLADRGVRLIGVDTPSVDLFSSKALPTHAACLRRDIVILEGLVLADVPEGVYELVALPLRLAGFDASPVRAILRSP